MYEISKQKEDMMLMEIINEERRNLRSQAKSDREMMEQIAKIIVAYSQQRF